MTTQRNEKWVLRVPKDTKGDTFISLFKKYLNTDSYKVIKRYTGKRPKGTSQVSTKPENATSTRLYIEEKHPEKQMPYWYDSNNARPNIHMAGSIVPTPPKVEEIKSEPCSTIDKTRLRERIEALEYKIEDLEELSNKHRKLNGELRVEAIDLFEVATTMMSILEQIDFSSTGINTCYDEVPWDKIERVLSEYRN